MFTRMPAYMYLPLLFAISEKGIKGQSVDGGVKKGVCMSERELKKSAKAQRKMEGRSGWEEREK